MKQATKQELTEKFAEFINNNNSEVFIGGRTPWSAHEVLAAFDSDWQLEFQYWLDRQIKDGYLVEATSAEGNRVYFWADEAKSKFKVRLEIRIYEIYEIYEIEVEAKSPDEASQAVYNMELTDIQNQNPMIDHGFYLADAMRITEVSEVEK